MRTLVILMELPCGMDDNTAETIADQAAQCHFSDQQYDYFVQGDITLMQAKRIIQDYDEVEATIGGRD